MGRPGSKIRGFFSITFSVFIYNIENLFKFGSSRVNSHFLVLRKPVRMRYRLCMLTFLWTRLALLITVVHPCNRQFKNMNPFPAGESCRWWQSWDWWDSTLSPAVVPHQPGRSNDSHCSGHFQLTMSSDFSVLKVSFVFSSLWMECRLVCSCLARIWGSF